MAARHYFKTGVLALLFVLFAHPAGADAGTFDAVVEDAQSGYRAALFYARTGNPALAGIELRQSQDAWDDIVAKYAAAPPAPYDKDKRFADDLQAIAAHIARGADLLDEEKAKEARTELAPVRDLIYGLRNRAGRKGYGECVTDLNRQMAVLYKWRHDRPDFAVAGTADKVTRESMKYRDILRHCRDIAPEARKSAADFQRIYDGADASISSMPRAVERKAPLGVVNILRELMSFDRILYFKLG